MPENSSSRHQLPFLVVAQAQKELTHNEAIARVDALLHPVVQGKVSAPPALNLADTGKCWLIASAGTGLWAGKADQIAIWGGGSWRYLNPAPAMRIRNIATDSDAVWSGSEWVFAPAVLDPQAGSVIDIEARAAIIALLSHFRAIGQFTT
jgi:Protein of unknown function (DUF2793)